MQTFAPVSRPFESGVGRVRTLTTDPQRQQIHRDLHRILDKKIEAFATPNQTTEVIVELLVNEVISRHGIVETINGSRIQLQV